MARASAPTKLSLDRWAYLMGISPLHFNGIYVRSPSICEQPWLQFEFQTADRVGREAVARAIAEAEDNVERHLGYRLAPCWETDEWDPTVRPWRPELFNLSVTDIRGFAQNTKLKFGHFISGGIRAKTLVEAGSAIVFTDEDGDTYNETATVTTAVVADQDPCELHAYYPGHNGEDEWEIRPLSV